MLGDGLTREVRTMRELRDGARSSATKAGEERETGAVAERSKGAGRLGLSASHSGRRKSAAAGGRFPAGCSAQTWSSVRDSG